MVSRARADALSSSVNYCIINMANGEEHGSAESFKLAAAMCLFAVAVIGGILPLRLKDVGSRVISSLNTAAGGVFFASAMVSNRMKSRC